MAHRKWTSKQKSQIILEGLSGKIGISQLCTKYEISQTQYYKWRDLFLQTCHQAFETKNINKKEMLIQSIKLEHPCWGYRSVWSYLK